MMTGDEQHVYLDLLSKSDKKENILNRINFVKTDINKLNMFGWC